MSVSYFLREEAAELDRRDEHLTGEIEDTEKRIVDLRRKRDDLRFHRAEMMAAAQALDGIGFEVERDEAGIVTVRVNPRPPSCTGPHSWYDPDKTETFCRVCGDVRKPWHA